MNMAAKASAGARLFDIKDLSARLPEEKSASAWIKDLKSAASDAELPELMAALDGSAEAAAFFGRAMAWSPYLRDCLLRAPDIASGLASRTVSDVVSGYVSDALNAAEEEGIGESALMERLRQIKLRAHATIGLADLAGAMDVMAVTGALSDLADAATRAAVRFLLRDAARQGKLTVNDADPETDSGWFILAMGKHGARELNFSSDIDLIGFFDPMRGNLADPVDGTETFSRLTRRLIRILQDRTADGYVFRTDFRLRPDPGSTPLALPVEAALNYYESRGQNWERAAMIKARSVAGDIAAGEAFLKELQPFVWRKYLDFAAIQDVHSIKRQIHAHRGHGEIAVHGHNVKLGRGGIREIEFFVQTQQLIAGGRMPDLRGRETLAMLEKLAERGWIDDGAREALTSAYKFLRSVEHRIQLVRDEQTHILPEDDGEFGRVAALAGYGDAKAFAARFIDVLKTVEEHYARLFEREQQLSGDLGNLVFTGDIADPGTIETFHQLGFTRPEDMIGVVRTWHYGRYNATRSVEARERLTELTPALLRAIAATGKPEETMLAFDRFLSGLPAGVQLFSILHSNPALLDLLLRIMGAAPRLAAIITHRPHVFDGMLDPQLFADIPTKAYLAERLDTFLRGAVVYEDILDRLRIFAAEQKFLIGMRLLTGAIDAVRAGKAFSDLADLAIDRALSAVAGELATRHGHVPGGAVAVIGMGKLGSRELTAGSDIDLIVLYDHDDDVLESDGEKPLAPSQYYARLTQRLIAAISAPTAEGILYEIDMRLRPSGNKGPIATRLAAFAKYQASEAWTWEHMALTRARGVAGSEDIIGRAGLVIGETVAAAVEKGPKELLKEARKMRALIAEEKPPKSLWDLKLVPGGIIDLEFIAQTAVLAGRLETDERPTGTASVLAAISATHLDPEDRKALCDAHKLYTDIAQMTRLCMDDGFDPDTAPERLTGFVLEAVDLPSIDVLTAHLKDTQKAVRRIFDSWMRGGDA